MFPCFVGLAHVHAVEDQVVGCQKHLSLVECWVGRRSSPKDKGHNGASFRGRSVGAENTSQGTHGGASKHHRALPHERHRNVSPCLFALFAAPAAPTPKITFPRDCLLGWYLRRAMVFSFCVTRGVVERLPSFLADKVQASSPPTPPPAFCGCHIDKLL